MSSWMNVCLQLVERKLQLSGRDKSNAALVYIVPYWVHITASPSQHTLLYQVWSKIKPFESYLISVLVSAELLLGLKKYFLLKNFLLRIKTEAQNFAGQEPAEPQAQEGQLLQLFTREGQSWRITRSICSTQKMTVKSGLKYQPCTMLISSPFFPQEDSGRCPCFRCPLLPKTFLILLSLGGLGITSKVFEYQNVPNKVLIQFIIFELLTWFQSSHPEEPKFDPAVHLALSAPR